MTENTGSDNVEAPLDFILPNAQLRWWRSWLSLAARNYLLNHLQTLPWQQPSIWMFGRLVSIPRQQVWMGDAHCSYRYSGVLFTPEPWTEPLRRLTLRVSEATGTPFNCVLLNRYQGGQDHMGWHSDDEVELGNAPSIGSLSLGQPRRFDLRHKSLPTQLELELGDGDLLLMAGTCQTHWLHAVPKQAKATGVRYNLTFRYIASKDDAS